MKNFAAITIILLLAICAVHLTPVNAQGLFVAKKINCTPFCFRVRCAPQRIKDCKRDEALIRGDGDCYCCDACVPVRRAEPQECPDCAAVSCMASEKPNSCLEQNKAYVPADGKCQCCDACVDLTTIPSH